MTKAEEVGGPTVGSASVEAATVSVSSAPSPAGHTPGPWVAFERETASNIYSKGNDGSLLAVVHSYSHGMPGRPDASQRAANARLIAAAPELLKLLKGVMESCLYAEDDGQIGVTMEPTLYPQQFDAICAAIKMAEGRS